MAAGTDGGSARLARGTPMPLTTGSAGRGGAGGTVGCASGCAHVPAQEAPRLPEQGQSAETRSPAGRQPWPGEQDSKAARMEVRALNPAVPGVGDVVSERSRGNG